MKCKYCNAEVQPNVRFCTTCGGDLSKFDKCVNCGEFIDKGTSICPNCGAEQHHEEFTERTSSKKWMWAVIVVILLAIIGGGAYFATNGGFGSKAMAEAVDSDSIAVVDPSDTIAIDTDIHSIDGIKARLNEILSKGMALPDEVAVEKYFSKDYNEVFSKVKEYDKRNIPEGEIGFWDMSIWGDGQGGLGNFHPEIIKVNIDSEQKASAIVYYVSDEIKGEKLTTKFDLLLENENWFIDEITDDNAFIYKEKMKEYINESGIASDSKSTTNGMYSMVGKVSKYAIHMNIEINGSDVKGYYYYDSQGSGNKVKLSGSLKEGGELMLNKFSNDGEETGYFEGIFDGIEYRGKNVNYNRDEYLPFSVAVE